MGAYTVCPWCQVMGGHKRGCPLQQGDDRTLVRPDGTPVVTVSHHLAVNARAIPLDAAGTPTGTAHPIPGPVVVTLTDRHTPPAAQLLAATSICACTHPRRAHGASGGQCGVLGCPCTGFDPR